MVADSSHHRLIDRWYRRGRQSLKAEKLVDRRRLDSRQKLPFRIGPCVLHGAGHIERSGCDQCQQHMLIDRQIPLPAVVLVVIVAEPVGEAGVDHSYRLTESSAGERRTPTSGVVRDDDGEALIRRTGPECRLAQSRVAQYCNLLMLDPLCRLQIVYHPAQSPGPRRKCSPLIPCRLPCLTISQSPYTLPHPAVLIRFNIPGIGCHHGISSFKYNLYLPPLCVVSACLLCGPVVPDADRFIRSHPVLREPDTLIFMDRVVAIEVQPHKRRNWPFHTVWQIDQQIDGDV